MHTDLRMQYAFAPDELHATNRFNFYDYFFSSPCGRTQEHLLKRFTLADPNANTR